MFIYVSILSRDGEGENKYMLNEFYFIDLL